jgi:hypothetical protein
MKGWPGWDRGHISKLVSKYDTTPIGRAKFLLALKEAAIQYVESEKNNAADENDECQKQGCKLEENELHGCFLE